MLARQPKVRRPLTRLMAQKRNPSVLISGIIWSHSPKIRAGAVREFRESVLAQPIRLGPESVAH